MTTDYLCVLLSNLFTLALSDCRRCPAPGYQSFQNSFVITFLIKVLHMEPNENLLGTSLQHGEAGGVSFDH